MAEVLATPSGVAAAVAFLRAQYAAHSETAEVRSKIPNPRPAKFTRVRLMGGTRSSVVRYAPMLTFECWAADDIAAESLGILTEALINAWPDIDSACTNVVEVGGLIYQPDPDTNVDRYVFTKQVYLRSVVLT